LFWVHRLDRWIIFSDIIVACNQFKMLQLNEMKIPDIIILIERLQEIQLFNTERFEFYINYRKERRYHCCPIDAIPFANTGHNGIHFAFLTDFKIDYNLHELPIICIAPSYDPCINYVAENIKDFFSLLMTIHYSTILAEEYKNRDSYLRIRKDYLEGYRSEFDQTAMLEQATFMRNKFNLDALDDVYKYLEEIKLRRTETVSTYSSEYSNLGISPFDKESITRFKLKANVANISDFLSTNNKSSRLQFYRDCAAAFSISGDNKEDVRKVISDHLLKDGYHEIAQNLKMY